MSYTNFWNRAKHRNDKLLHTGFDYRGNIFKKTLSNVFYRDAKREAILNDYDRVLVYIVDHIKTIKKTFNWTVDKDYRDFN